MITKEAKQHLVKSAKLNLKGLLALLKSTAGRTARIGGDWAMPIGVGSYAGYKAHEAGLDPVTSVLLGGTAAAVASPRDYINAAKRGYRMSRGPESASPMAPASEIMKQMLKPLGTKAILAGLATVPALGRNIINSGQNVESTTDRLRKSTEAVGSLTDKLPKFDEIQAMGQGFNENLQKSLTKVEGISKNTSDAVNRASDTLGKHISDGMGQIGQSVGTAAKVTGAVVGGASIAGLAAYLLHKVMSNRDAQVKKKPGVGSGTTTGGMPRKQTTHPRFTLQKPGDYTVHLDQNPLDLRPSLEESSGDGLGVGTGVGTGVDVVKPSIGRVIEGKPQLKAAELNLAGYPLSQIAKLPGVQGWVLRNSSR